MTRRLVGLKGRPLKSLVGSVVGGSVLVYLGANPYVYSEDKAWSVALAIGAFLALLGMLECPSWRRVFSCGLLVLAANLTRSTGGYSCVIGALLVAAWFALPRHRSRNCQWWVPMFGVAILSVAAASAVSWAKFGLLFGLPLNDYTAFHLLNEKRINGGHYFGFEYLPSTLLAYLQPGGLRFTSLFPYITLPAGPTRTIGGVLFDNRTRTASLTASMPLLFLLGCVGLVSAFQWSASQHVKMLRIVLVASATGTGAVLFYGWIANRYLADFLPFLVISAAMGAAVLWNRLDGRSKRTRVTVLGFVALLGVFSVTANVALSLTPTDSWTPAQASRFLRIVSELSNITGHPLNGQILRGTQLPYWAPADTVFVAGNCQGLYVSNGENYTGVLNQRAEHRTWVAVEEGAEYSHNLDVTFGAPTPSSQHGVPLVDFGNSRVFIHSTVDGGGSLSVWFTVQDPKFSSSSIRATVTQGTTHLVNIVTDRYADTVSVSMGGVPYVDGPITTHGVATVNVNSQLDRSGESFSSLEEPTPSTSMSLCRSISSSS